MRTYNTKFKAIVPTFTTIAFGSAILITFLRWLLTIQFEFIEINEEIWKIWIPILFPWIPITIWLRPRFRVLTFKKDNDKGRVFFQFLSWILIMPILLITQELLTTATGKLANLTSIEEIDQVEKERYYRIDDFYVSEQQGIGLETSYRGGKYKSNLILEFYYVVPIKPINAITLNYFPKHWYGLKRSKRIKNNLNPKEKKLIIADFYKECYLEMKNYDFYNVDHFVRTPNSTKKRNYLRAVEYKINDPIDKSFIILEPQQTKFENRNGNKFAWIFIIFGIGIGIFSLLLIIPGYKLPKQALSENEEL